MIAATHAMTGVVRTLRSDKAKMLRYAAQNVSTMTDLADALARETGIDFRQAQEVIARVISAAIDSGKTADQVDARIIQTAAKAQLSLPLKISAAAVRDARDPVKTSHVATASAIRHRPRSRRWSPMLAHRSPPMIKPMLAAVRHIEKQPLSESAACD